jgi:hypothetical protein
MNFDFWFQLEILILIAAIILCIWLGLVRYEMCRIDNGVLHCLGRLI